MKLYNILDIALDTENIYRHIVRLKGLDWLTSFLLKLLNNPDNHLITLEDNGVPIAFVILKRDMDKWYIYEMAVRDKYRHTGIVRQLINTARKDGIKTIQWSRRDFKKTYNSLKLDKDEHVFISRKEVVMV